MLNHYYPNEISIFLQPIVSKLCQIRSMSYLIHIWILTCHFLIINKKWIWTFEIKHFHFYFHCSLNLVFWFSTFVQLLHETIGKLEPVWLQNYSGIKSVIVLFLCNFWFVMLSLFLTKGSFEFVRWSIFIDYFVTSFIYSIILLLFINPEYCDINKME